MRLTDLDICFGCGWCHRPTFQRIALYDPNVDHGQYQKQFLTGYDTTRGFRHTRESAKQCRKSRAIRPVKTFLVSIAVPGSRRVARLGLPPV